MQVESVGNNQDNEESMCQSHWKTVKIRHTSYCLVGMASPKYLTPVLKIIMFSFQITKSQG